MRPPPPPLPYKKENEIKTFLVSNVSINIITVAFIILQIIRKPC